MKTIINYGMNPSMEAARRDIAEYLGKDYHTLVERFAGAIENICVMTWETWHYPAFMLGIEGYPADVLCWDIMEAIEKTWNETE